MSGIDYNLATALFRQYLGTIAVVDEQAEVHAHDAIDAARVFAKVWDERSAPPRVKSTPGETVGRTEVVVGRGPIARTDEAYAAAYAKGWEEGRAVERVACVAFLRSEARRRVPRVESTIIENLAIAIEEGEHLK